MAPVSGISLTPENQLGPWALIADHAKESLGPIS